MRAGPYRIPLVLTLALATFLPGLAAAQAPSLRAAAALRLGVHRTVPPALAVAAAGLPTIPDSTKKKDHTATGLAAGAVVGFLGGWLIYNGLCEAAMNQCTNSRLPSLMFGAMIGAAVGGVLGSLSD